MSAKLIDDLTEQLFQANHEWPQDQWFSAGKFARTLAGRVARVVGDSPIEFALARIDSEGPGGTAKVFHATVFTAGAVIAGSMAASENDTYPPKGDVSIVPRTALRSLVLNHVQNFEEATAQTQTYFTATYEGLPTPLVVDHGIYSYQNQGRAGQLFDALSADLLRTAGTVGPPRA